MKISPKSASTLGKDEFQLTVINRKKVKNMTFSVVMSSDLFDRKKNPTLCLSPHRYTKSCHLCGNFRVKVRTVSSIEELKDMKCKPRFDESAISDYLLKLEKNRECTEELRRIRKRIGW